MSTAISVPSDARETPAPAERHYSPAEVAKLWCLDVETIRRLFENESGVLALRAPFKKGRRRYTTLRIPQSVLERVYRRFQR
jgi:hypothetical protein